MKGLLLKDFYMMTKYYKSILLIMVIFIAVSLSGSNNLFFIFYPCLLSGVIPITLLSYDERSKWNEYCGTLPYKKSQLVSAKYLIGLFVQISVLILSGIVQAIRMNIDGVFILNNYLVLMAMLLIVSCVSASVFLPFMFKLGVEKGRIVYYVMIILVSATSIIVARYFNTILIRSYL